MTGGASNPMAGRSRLRRALRDARTSAGLTQRQAAIDLGWSESKLIRIEAGQISISARDLLALLTRYGVDDQERVMSLVGLAQDGRRQPWTGFRDVLKPEFVIYLGYEEMAARLFQFEPLVVPGILQTPEYATALIRSVAPPTTDDHVLKRQAEAREARQELLERDDAPRMHFIIDESAIRRRPGLPGQAGILRRQLARLLELGTRPMIDIQVLPLTFGTHLGLTGAFVILEFDDPEEEDVLFREHHERTVVTRDRAKQIGMYKDVFLQLQRGASDPGGIETVIDQILADLDG